MAGGFVVALVGPDGLGKSTQVDRLAQIFRWKFGCAQAYVGTGDGRGWWLRKGLQSLVFPHRRRLKSLAHDDGKNSSAKLDQGRRCRYGVGIWGRSDCV